MGYSIWLEFEEYADSDVKGTDDGYCNVEVLYDDGRRLAYNVWTIEFFKNNITSIVDTVKIDGYATFPDIIVSRLERKHITDVLKKLLE